MKDYAKNFLEEKEHLDYTISKIKEQLTREERQLSRRKKNLRKSRREMWEDAGHFPTDFAGAAEISQYRSEAIVQTETYLGNLARIEMYKRMVDSPYFGRFDILEEGQEDVEKIYVGLGTFTDADSFKVLVYDWRAPISSVFYRSELGPAEYETPSGTRRGEVLLKRQYKIRKGKLLHFFDSGILIRDEVLQDILSRNASTQMRTIVESIQKEQDMVIRDNTHGLVIVQGAAGSGKTSIALHRVAYLLYEGLENKLNWRDILILSPNQVFSQYIANVLPDLGEENVEEITFDSVAGEALEGLSFETRGEQLERIIEMRDSLSLENIDFKGSRTFVKILDRFLDYYQRKLIPFEDVYYNGVVLATRQQMKSRFLMNRNVPMARRLKHIEKLIWEEVEPLRRTRLKKIEGIVQAGEGHDLEIKPYSRLLSMKESRRFGEKLHRFTKVDWRTLYRTLFEEKVFSKVAAGMDLPDSLDRILEQTRSRLEKGTVFFEDAVPLLYLKLKVEGTEKYSRVKHIVIDEAQDYSPLQYEILKKLFRWADLTVLGDVDQRMGTGAGMSLYDDILKVFAEKDAVKLVLSKTYRSSYEISQFTQRLLGREQLPGAFERHDEAPRIVESDTEQSMEQGIASEAAGFLAHGFESVAVICKTRISAEKLYKSLEKLIPAHLHLVGPDSRKFYKGITVIPVYMAKGLEFDAVIVYGADKKNYFTELDNRLLYIACTRALHRLVLYYTGEKSPFLP